MYPQQTNLNNYLSFDWKFLGPSECRDFNNQSQFEGRSYKKGQVVDNYLNSIIQH